MKQLKGNAVSPGIAYGPVYIHSSQKLDVIRHHISKSQVNRELIKFENIKERTKNSFDNISENLSGSIKKEADQLLVSHSLIIDDITINRDIREYVRNNQCNIEFAINEVFEALIQQFRNIEDPYLKERTLDLLEIRDKLLSNSSMDTNKSWTVQIQKPSIIVCDELTATDILSMNLKKVLAIIAERGSQYSHASILAKSFEIPVIVNVKNALNVIKDDDQVIFNSFEDAVIIDPDKSSIREFRRYQENLRKINRQLANRSKKKVLTVDNRAISINANIESINEAEISLKKGIDGVGLFRTEYLFIEKNELIDEDAQFKEYRKVLTAFKSQPVTIRTMDIGGDKLMDALTVDERNPLLGCRAIRYSFKNLDAFRSQVRAILRASRFGRARILLPMISSHDELQAVLREIERIKRQLTSDNILFDPEIETGIMVEVPSAVLVLKDIIKKIDFIALGTNDLIQYTIAVDRDNPLVSNMFQPLHPAVLRLIKMSVDICAKAGKDLSICGEMGGDPFYLPLLIGMGITNFSMGASSIFKIKDIISKLSFADCEKLASHILSQSSVLKSKQILIDFIFNNLHDKVEYDIVKVY